MAMTRLPSHSQAARFYDLLGAGLDTQPVYEAAVVRDLVAHLNCRHADLSLNSALGPATRH